MRQIFFWSLVAALAGLLFGFDTVVISGADKKLQNLWQSSDAFHGSEVMAMALWGTVVGALFGGYPSQKLGRKKTLSGLEYSTQSQQLDLLLQMIRLALLFFDSSED